MLASYPDDDAAPMRARFRGRTVDLLVQTAPELYAKVERVPTEGLGFSFGPPESLDMVLMMRMAQNIMLGGGLEPFLAGAFTALKPGGVLAVEQHRGPAGVTTPGPLELGYLPEP